MRWDGHEFDQAPGDGDGQGSLTCCGPLGLKESDMTDWTDLDWTWPNTKTAATTTKKIVMEWIIKLYVKFMVNLLQMYATKVSILFFFF